MCAVPDEETFHVYVDSDRAWGEQQYKLSDEAAPASLALSHIPVVVLSRTRHATVRVVVASFKAADNSSV